MAKIVNNNQSNVANNVTLAKMEQLRKQGTVSQETMEKIKLGEIKLTAPVDDVKAPKDKFTSEAVLDIAATKTDDN